MKFDSLSRNKGKSSETNIHTARFTSIDCLSYTFRAFHAQVQENHQDRSQYSSDLEKTLEINFQIISSFIFSLQLINDDKTKLIDKIKSILQFHEKKKELMKSKSSIRSKVLIDLQINGEAKRRKEELNDFQIEKKEEQKNAIDKKTITVKRFQKKFNEVEMYIHRECHSSAKYRNKFSEYEIIPFLYANETYIISKTMLGKDMKTINNDIMIILKENSELKQREENRKQEAIEKLSIKEKEKKSDESNNYKNIFLSYNSKIKHFVSTNRQLKQHLHEIHNLIKLQTIQKSLIEDQSQYGNSNIINTNHINIVQEDQLLFNLTGIRTTEENANEGEHLDTFNNKETQFKWDISCIEKTEENQYKNKF